MTKIVRDLIEYYFDEGSYIKAPNFKQLNVDFMFLIPYDKPDIKNVLKVWSEPCIYYKKVIKTPEGISLEGQNLTGSGVLIEGNLNVKIEYLSSKENISTHTIDNYFPFSAYIVLPELFNFNSIVTTSILIEDVDITLLSEKQIYCNITLMAIADIC